MITLEQRDQIDLMITTGDLDLWTVASAMGIPVAEVMRHRLVRTIEAADPATLAAFAAFLKAVGASGSPRGEQP